jgi:hypothetical protein
MGSLGFLMIFIYRLLKLIMIIHSAPKKKIAEITFVYTEHISGPFSFFKYMFIGHAAEQKPDWDLIYRHERAHMVHWHSIDLILAEIMIIVFWFNPLAWLMRFRLTEIHEYQADEAVLRSNIDAREYQITLLKYLVSGVNASLISAFSHNLILRRIRMIQLIKKTENTSYKLILLIPILALSILVNTITAQDQGFRCPLDTGRITSEFGMRLHPIKKEMIHHNGIDIAAVRGTPVYCIDDGIVLESGEQNASGQFIIIGHKNDWQSFYAQLEKSVVEADQEIEKGELIGYVGSSGISTAPHLHFELRSEGARVDPRTEIDFKGLERE